LKTLSGCFLILFLFFLLSRPAEIALSDSVELINDCFSGTKNVITACRECHVRKLIYNSTAHVIFDGSHDIHNGDESLTCRWKACFFIAFMMLLHYKTTFFLASA